MRTAFVFPKPQTIPVMQQLKIEKACVVKYDLGVPGDQMDLIENPATSKDVILVDEGNHDYGSETWRIDDPFRVSEVENKVTLYQAIKGFRSKPEYIKSKCPKSTVLAYNIPPLRRRTLDANGIDVNDPTPGSYAELAIETSFPAVSTYDGLCPQCYLWYEDQSWEPSKNAIRVCLDMSPDVWILVNYRHLETAKPENQGRLLDQRMLFAYITELLAVRGRKYKTRKANGVLIWHIGYADGGPNGHLEQIDFLKAYRDRFPYGT